MTEHSSIAVLDDLEHRLAEIATVQEAKKLRDQAATMQQYLKVRREGLKVQNAAALVKFRAERRAGELLRATPRRQGKRNVRDGLVLTIKRSGVSLQTAYRWMNLAIMPERDLQKAAAECNESQEELTSTLVYEVLVPQWTNRRRASWRPNMRDVAQLSAADAAQDLVTCGVLKAGDLLHLPPTTIKEVREIYEEFCEDPGRRKVPSDEWNPMVTIDRRCLRTLALDDQARERWWRLPHDQAKPAGRTAQSGRRAGDSPIGRLLDMFLETADGLGERVGTVWPPPGTVSLSLRVEPEGEPPFEVGRVLADPDGWAKAHEKYGSAPGLLTLLAKKEKEV